MSKIFKLLGVSELKTVPQAAKIQDFCGGHGLIIAPVEGRARRIASDLSFFASCKVLFLPDDDSVLRRYDARSTELLAERMSAYRLLLGDEPGIVVSSGRAALLPLPPQEVFLRDLTELAVGERIERDELIRRLSDMGYERTALVEAAGQFSVRGDILDVFCPGDSQPLRMEFFDSEVESLRRFDPLSQRSTERINRIGIYPACLLLYDEEVFSHALGSIDLRSDIGDEDKAFAKTCIEERMNFQYLERFMSDFYPEPEYIWDYMRGPAFIMADEPFRIEEEIGRGEYENLIRGIEGSGADKIYYCMSLPGTVRCASRPDEIHEPEIRRVPLFSGRMDMLVAELRRYASDGFDIKIVCSSQERIINLRELFEREGIGERINFLEGELSSGHIFADYKEVYISDRDIFPYSRRRRRPRRDKGAEIKAFSDLGKGDLVVHELHGIGRFAGVEKMDVQGSVRDYLRIEYAGTDLLYVPVDQMDSLQKYIGDGGSAPRINSLSGIEWQRTKARAKAAIKDMAEDLLRLSAERAARPGFSFGSDSVWQKEFEEAFPYVETEDQLRCTEEIKRDMESSRSMDRLLCGDVGYGKTEVACRAIFKCIEQGKQAAVLVPTTILANQHYHNFTERFSAYPFRIEMLSRFRSQSEQAKIVKDVAGGRVDLVVGTHRLLSPDVKFKDPGLLVVDEEHRFGVAQKEVIKRLKTNLDVLSLSATPIPRTLHMSLAGIRDMSLIEEAPEDRYPVRTYVLEEDDELLSQAIKRELDRGGQVFVVYNRVRGIQAAARRIRDLVPSAEVVVGHGQMPESELEDVMLDFVGGKSDILVSTTIIESGLDIPNVNTLIVMDADKFGLSQLYQLRGRVGRSNRMAYAYLMYRRGKVLSEASESRLKAIREFTEFGSGFRIAMRDLELRGAGNILGAEQSGHMMSVGYELYCKLVDEAVRELRGEPAPEPLADTSVELGLPAYIPGEYISDELMRLDVYKSIASCATDSDRSDILDELGDRFGEPPRQTLNLIETAITRSLASRCGIARLVAQKDKLVFAFAEENILRPEIFAKLADIYGSSVSIYGGREPRISLAVREGDVPRQAQEVLKLILEARSAEDGASEDRR